MLLGYTLPFSSKYTEGIMLGSVGRLIVALIVVVSGIGLFVLVGVSDDVVVSARASEVVVTSVALTSPLKRVHTE